MAVALYRPGGTHKIRGVKCEMQIFSTNCVDNAIETGWFYSPEGCYDVVEQVSSQTDGILSIDDMTDDEIRILAKERKIKNWYNKGIDKLKTEIDAWQPEN